MDWLTKYWWVLVLVFLVGVMINVIKDLTRVDHKNFSTINRICPRIATSTTSGTTMTTGRRTTRRRRSNILLRIAIKQSPGEFDAGQVARTDAQHRLRENILLALFSRGGA